MQSIITANLIQPLVFYHFDGHQLSTFNPYPRSNIFVADDPTGVKTRKAHAERFEEYLEELISNNELIDVVERDKNNKTVGGYIDLLGNVVIPLEHHRLGDFSEGLVVASDPENSKFLGYLNKTGKLVIPYEYTSGKMFNKGAARVCQGDDCFYINKQGKKVADPNQKKATTSKKQSNKKQSSGKSAAAGAVAGGVVGGIKGGIIGGVIGAIVGD
ncbi:MAG: WG repeat-containing protein [Neisseriaceae bacterium]|nr:WG repeat-containing protein [Neisseriaceae bacterium]